MSRRARATIDVGAIEANARTIHDRLSPRTHLCAVVKANGYGHGIRHVANAALAGGATWLAVATAEEAAQMRVEHPDVPILILGPLDHEDAALAITIGAEVVAWSSDFILRLGDLASGRDVGVHIKLDTGMCRWGVQGTDAAAELAVLIETLPHLRLSGLMTHFSTADETSNDFFDRQLQLFNDAVQVFRRTRPHLMVHAANSAATLRDPRAHFDMVRCGIALYGLDPYQSDPRDWDLRPALELTSYVAKVAQMRPGDAVGYGRAYAATSITNIATIPFGYADGARRVLGRGIEVLIDGRRYRVTGNVSMDCLAVDLGPTTRVKVGDQVVLIGASGPERIYAEEVAQRYGTITDDVVCTIGERVERVYVGQ